MRKLWPFLLLTLVMGYSSGYKILFLAPFNGKSHFLFMKSFVIALLNRGHEVTLLTSNTLSNLKLANYSEVLVDPPLHLDSLLPPEMLFNPAGSAFTTIGTMVEFPKLWNSYNFESASVQKFIHSEGSHFDLVINEEFFGDSFLMFAHKFNAPIVTICPFGFPDYVDRMMGLLTPLSVVPHWMLPFSDNMSFYQRWHNTLVSAYDGIMRKYVALPNEEELAWKHFAHLAPLPSIKDLLLNVSIVLVNTHRAIFPPRPTLPSIVSIGGAHIKPAKSLPKHSWINRSTESSISGTVVNSSKLPKEKIQAFLDTFKTLKQRVLWKFEDESLADVPPNVMIKKWMPQNDILAHPNVILFISHGGLFGTSESLYHGVPLLLIPFFGDQHRNAHRIEMAGYGKFLLFGEITQESFTRKITEIISNEEFLTKAKETSAIFKDNLVHPMDEAMFWIEHVAKFRGAKHLKSHAVHLSWFSFLLVDVIIVNLLALFAIFFTIYYLARKYVSKNTITQIGRKKQQ